MPYVLGIDVGTCRTAAALRRQAGSSWGEPEAVPLGDRAPTIPTIVYFAPDGSVVVGDAAERHAMTDPANTARDFTRRIGDEVPLLVGREVCPAESLTAVLITWVVKEVSAAEGLPPEHVVVTHPAGWGNHRKRLLHQALRQTSLDDVTLVPEPVAISEHHAATHDVRPGTALGVYDLGATGLATAVVRRSPIGTFELLSSAESVDSNGGDSFDDAVFDFVRAGSGGVDTTDPDAWLKLVRLRQECVTAKEFLSTGSEVPVHGVLLTRPAFEDMIRTPVLAGIEELLRVIRPAADMDTVVVAGGSARIPLVGELVRTEVPGRAVVAPDPETACARGAAIVASRVVPAPHSAPLPAVTSDDPPERPSVDIEPLDLPVPRTASRVLARKPKVTGGITALVLAVGVGLTFYLSGEQPPKNGSTPAPVAPVNNTKQTPGTPQPAAQDGSAHTKSGTSSTPSHPSPGTRTGEDGR